MIHIREGEDDGAVMTAMVFKKLQPKSRLYIAVVLSDWVSGGRPTIRLLFATPQDDGTYVELDECLPVKYIPKASIDWDFILGLRAVDDVFAALACNIVARKASVKLVYDRLENGVDVHFSLGKFKNIAFMKREHAERYFILPEED